MTTFRSAPEFASVEAFAQYMYDEDRTDFSHEDLHALGYRTRTRIDELRVALGAYGLRLGVREIPKPVRGFTTSSNDRWFGPGACKTYGGAAYGSMMVAKYGSKDAFGG